MAKTKKTAEDYVPTTHAALTLCVSANTLYRWQNFKGFPEDAVKRTSNGNLYDVAAIRKWLSTRKRPYVFAQPNAA